MPVEVRTYFPTGSPVCILDSKLVSLFWKVVGPQGGGALLEKVDCWGQALRSESLASFSYSLSAALTVDAM